MSLAIGSSQFSPLVLTPSGIGALADTTEVAMVSGGAEKPVQFFFSNVG